MAVSSPRVSQKGEDTAAGPCGVSPVVRQVAKDITVCIVLLDKESKVICKEKLVSCFAGTILSQTL